MDVFSHGLWAGAFCKALNIKRRQPFSFWKAVWWGVFPDLLAFTALFARFFWVIISTGSLSIPELPRVEGVEETVPVDDVPLYHFTAALYAISHSAIIWLLVFSLTFFMKKKPAWELGAWLFHIVLDIFTHTSAFYPTPFLWPLSGFTVNGISWATPWFLALNYLMLAVFYFGFFKKRRVDFVNSSR